MEVWTVSARWYLCPTHIHAYPCLRLTTMALDAASKLHETSFSGWNLLLNLSWYLHWSTLAFARWCATKFLLGTA